MGGKKLIVLGIDGADWKIVQALSAEGSLPNFSRVMAEGSHSRLRSTIPPLTAPAWTTIFTGVNPGKHGIFDFAMLTEGKRKFTSGDDRMVPYFWDLMHNHKVLAYNIPCSYPPKAAGNTLLVSGYCTPGPEAEFTAPRSLKGEILSLVPDYDFNPGAESNLVKLGASGDKSKICASVERSLEGRLKVSEHLLASKKWDAAFIVFSETDWIQHYFMHEFEAAVAKSSCEVARIYKPIDAFLGRLIDGGHNVLIVSDHGFKLVRRLFYMNTYLVNGGMLRLRAAGRKSIMQRLGITRDRALSLLPVWLFKIVKKSGFMANLGRMVFPTRSVTEDNIDLKASKAYLFSNSGGMVLCPGGSADDVCRYVAEARDEDGIKPVEEVFRRESIYSGEAVRKAPHLVTLSAGDNFMSAGLSKRLSREVDPSAELSGYHDLHGIFLALGPDLVPRGRMGDHNVEDIAPTVLSFFGYPPPAFMDGKAIGVLGSGIGVRDGLKSSTLLAIKKLVKRKAS